MYPPDSPFKVYEQSIWWSDSWSGLSYGRPIDWNRTFFEQFRDLQLAVPRVALVNKHSENALYTNHSGKNKNCYLSAVTFESEDIYYSDWIIGHCRSCIDCSYLLEGCELCYETYYAWGSYRAFFCEFVKRCNDMWFSYDCQNCSDCLLCCNLRNKKYCIQNRQCTEDEYKREMTALFPLSAESVAAFRRQYIDMKQHRAIHPATYQLQSEQCSGDLLFTSKNCFECYDSISMHDCRYCYDGIDAKDSADVYHVGWAELMYECHAISHAYNCIGCHFTYDNKNVYYCDCTQNSHDLFGCAGLNQSSYCILNKQYTQEEYKILVPKLIEHMQKNNEWGEFFPIEYSPFAYNQSRAQEYFSLNEKEARARGVRWSDYEPPVPEVKKVIEAADIPDHITDVPDDIVEWAIRCEVTRKPFRVIAQELDFYRETGLPVPRCHPDQRYSDRMQQRKPRRLWDRTCAKCQKPISTSYAPERPETVYCERCYLETVY